MIALLATGVASAHVPVIYFAGPEDDWCAVIDGTEGSDIVMLSGGEYTGPCEIVAHPSDDPTEQTTVQSLDPLDPAVFVGTEGDFVLRVTGERLLLLELAFRDLPDDVDAVRIGPIRDLAVRRSWFHRLGGGGVVQEAPVAGGIVVGDTEFLDVARPMVLGCGGACGWSALEVSENLVVGGAAEGSAGVVVAGPHGLVLDNVLSGVGAGIRIDGAAGGVEVGGNLVDAAGAAIAVTGAASVRANVGIGAPAGVAGEGAVVAGNTWVGPLEVAGARLVGNAVLGPDPALPDDVATVVCDAACFVDAGGWDFFPAPGSPLRGGGVADEALGRDWCGRVRADPPSVGAIEAFGDASFGPLAAVFKDDIDCSLPDLGTDPTGPEPTAPDDPPAPPKGREEPPETPLPPEGCGCGPAGSVPSAALGLLGLVAIALARPQQQVARRSPCSIASNPERATWRADDARAPWSWELAFTRASAGRTTLRRRR